LGHGRYRRSPGAVEGLTGGLFKPSSLSDKSQIFSGGSRLKRAVSTEGIVVPHTASLVQIEQTLYVSGHLARLNGTVWTGGLGHDVSP